MWRSDAPSSMTLIRMSAKSKSTVLLPYRQAARSGDPEHFLDGRNAELDLLQAVITERRHALVDCHLADLIGRRALDREIADLVRVEHDLVEADPAAIAGVVATSAADRLVGVEVGVGVEALRAHGVGGERDLPLAIGAQLARQPLRDDAVDRRRAEERLDVHLGQPGD